MEESNLCVYCRKIDFNYLRCPTRGEVEDASKGNIKTDRYPFKPDPSQQASPSFDLGPLSRVKKNEDACRLCSAIWTMINRAGMVEDLKKEGYSEEIFLQAAMCFNATLQFNGQDPDFFFLRRMAIACRSVDDSTDTMIMGAWDCFQACDIGAIQPQAPAYQSFLNGPPKINQTVYCGRRRPLVVDLQFLQRWLQDCDVEHGRACHLTGEDDVRKWGTFRLINVKRKAVETFTDTDVSHLKYVALSYMWGTTQKLKLVSANRNSLSEDNALDGTVSRTIVDAIELSRSLGIDYLWVDALCIIQDSDMDKKEQISHMDSIYREASLTIIAAAGDNADAGLPGLTAGSRIIDQEEIIVRKPGPDDPGMSIVTTLSSVTAGFETLPLPFSKTNWNTRGWTLQERALSPRVLTFTEEQIYWACQCSQWCEDTYLEFSSLAKFRYYSANREELSLRVNDLIPQWARSYDSTDQLWHRYQVLVKQFGQKMFTFESDAHDAFAAIIKDISRISGECFVWGMPASRFELALDWSAREGVARRNTLTTLPMTSLNRRVPFPSWSWLGWKGPCQVSIMDDRVEMGEEPEVMCYIHRNSPLRILRVGRLFADTGKVNEIPLKTGGLDTLVSRIEGGQKPMGVSLPVIELFYPELTAKALSDVPDEQLLFFWTSTASFNTRVEPHDFYSGRRVSHILDRSGKEIGLTGFWGEQQVAENICPTGIQHFIVIGSRKVLDYTPKVTVLQVEKRGDIYYRVNTAEIEEAAWEDMKPSWILAALG